MPNSDKRRKPIRGRPRDKDADARILKTALRLVDEDRIPIGKYGSDAYVEAVWRTVLRSSMLKSELVGPLGSAKQ
jgi:hypothetical protein